MTEDAKLLSRRASILSKHSNKYNFNEHMENYNVETTALHRKLQSKTDALNIMRKDLERFRTERDQFKLMAETLQLRYSALSKHTDFAISTLPTGSNTTVASLLRETRERNIKLTTEIELLKQKLCDLQGDIEALRAKEKRSSTKLTCNMEESIVHSNAELEWKQDRADFICHLESLKRQNAQLAFDIRTLLDEKHELTTERDAYKCKAHRLNHELRNALMANEKHSKLIDIDSIILENNFLHECLKNAENELEITKQTANKYKTMIETKKKKGFIRLDNNTTVDTSSILSHKQVKSLIESGVELPTCTETVQDLKSLSLMLLDTLNDKNLALSHQKKTNKILAVKISELERRLMIILGKDESDKLNFSPSETLLHMYCPSSVDSSSSSSQLPELTNTDLSDTTEAETTILAAVCKQQIEEEENATVEDASEHDDTMQAEQIRCDDNMSTSNSDSCRSITSSEYDGTNATSSNFNALATTTIYAYTTPSSASSKDTNSLCRHHISLPNSILRERLETLKDLPPDLAKLVEQTLYELDMRDYESENVNLPKKLLTDICNKQCDDSSDISIYESTV